MNIETFADPWTHAIVDNFFTFEENHIIRNYARNEFQHLPNDQTFKFILRENKKFKGRHHDRSIWNYCSNIARSKFPELCKHLNVPEIDHELWVEFSCFGSACPRGIHNDRPEKYISCLVYLDGTGSGTWLYSDSETLEKKIEFRHNRAFVFHNTRNKIHAVGDNKPGDYRTAVNFIFAQPADK